MSNQPKLTKSNTDKMLCGVCGGLAKQMGLDSTILRLLWVVGSVVTGFVLGLVLYLIFALIIPNE